MVTSASSQLPGVKSMSGMCGSFPLAGERGGAMSGLIRKTFNKRMYTGDSTCSRRLATECSP